MVWKFAIAVIRPNHQVFISVADTKHISLFFSRMEICNFRYGNLRFQWYGPTTNFSFCAWYKKNPPKIHFFWRTRAGRKILKFLIFFNLDIIIFFFWFIDSSNYWESISSERIWIIRYTSMQAAGGIWSTPFVVHREFIRHTIACPNQNNWRCFVPCNGSR